MTLWRWAAVAVLLAAAIYAWTGGSYPQREYLALRHREDAARHQLDSLRGEVDSLRAFRDSLVAFPEVQERMVRERSGMIRPGELMVILEPEHPAP